MKKVLCLTVALLLLITCCACGDKKKSVTSDVSAEHVDANTITIVNDAFKSTASAISGALSLGFTSDNKKTVTVDDVSTGKRVSETVAYKKGEARLVSYGIIERSDSSEIAKTYYTDGSAYYAATADKTYALPKDAKTEEFIMSFVSRPGIVDASTYSAVNTNIVNAADGGYGFVITYDPAESDFDAKSYFGSLYDSTEGLALNVKSLKISGIIGSDGRLKNERITYTYTYDFDQEVVDTTIDPDNVTTTSEPTVVKKTATVELSSEIAVDFTVNDVLAPEKVVIPQPDADGKVEKLKEISLTEYDKLYEPETKTDSKTSKDTKTDTTSKSSKK